MTHSISDPCFYTVCALGIYYGYVWWQLRTFIVSRWNSVDIYSQINILEGSFWFLARPFNCGPWKIWYFLLIEKSFEDVHSINPYWKSLLAIKSYECQGYNVRVFHIFFGVEMLSTYLAKFFFLFILQLINYLLHWTAIKTTPVVKNSVSHLLCGQNWNAFF